MTYHGRLALAASIALLAGCGSVVTFSKVSREQGIRDLDAGMYPEAEGAFADAIRQNPRDYQSHAYLARLYDRRKEYANALAHFKTSLDVQPLTVEGQADEKFRVQTLTAQADTMAKVPDNDRSVNAVAAYDHAARQAPDKFYIAKAQGLYLARQGIRPQAEQALTRAYALGDRDTEVAAALRSLGIVPGPSLKEPGALSKPVLPVGPLPDLINRNRAPLRTDNVPADVKE